MIHVAETPVTDTGITAVAPMQWRLGRVSDKSVQELAQRCPNLEELDLDGCSSLTLETVNVVATQMPKLTALRVLNLSCLTDAALMRLVEACSLLTHLRLAAESALTDPGVRTAMRQCRDLTFLSIITCDGYLTEAAAACVPAVVVVEILRSIPIVQ